MSGPRIRVTPNEVALDTAPLRVRHWLVLAAMVALAAALWRLNVARISAAVAAVNPPASFPIRPEDDEAHVYGVIASGAARRAGVVVVGTSVVNAALWTDDSLSREAGVGVANLSGRGQTTIQSLFVLYRAGLHAGQTVVVMVSPGMYTRAREDDWRITSGLLGPVVGFAEQFHATVPGLDPWLEPGAQLAFQRGFQRQWLYRVAYGSVRRWAAHTLYGDDRPVFNQHRQNRTVPDGDERTIVNSHQIMQRRLARTFDRNRAATVQLLEVITRFAHSQGARVVLLESPRVSADTLATYGQWWARYRADIRAIADSNTVPLVDFNPALDLRHAEFRDGWHLARAGRDRFSRAFVGAIQRWCPAGRCG